MESSCGGDCVLSKPPIQLAEGASTLSLEGFSLGGNFGGGLGGRTGVLDADSFVVAESVFGLGGIGGWENGEGEVGSLPPLLFWFSGSVSSSRDS